MAAWPAVAGRGLQLVLVGDGPLRDELAAWARSAAVAGSVELAGYRADPAVFYRSADLFLFPSRSESFGNVIVEAMLHGLPVLTTAVGAPGRAFEVASLGEGVGVIGSAASAVQLVPEIVKEGLEIVPVETVSEVLDRALSRKPVPIEWDEESAFAVSSATEEDSLGGAPLAH